MISKLHQPFSAVTAGTEQLTLAPTVPVVNTQTLLSKNIVLELQGAYHITIHSIRKTGIPLTKYVQSKHQFPWTERETLRMESSHEGFILRRLLHYQSANHLPSTVPRIVQLRQDLAMHITVLQCIIQITQMPTMGFPRTVNHTLLLRFVPRGL